MLGVSEILEKAKVKELVKAHVAVLDGNELAPSQPQKHGKVTANTLWGELAWQLGKEDGYALVAGADKDGTSPGKDVLGQLLERFGPAVILMDETVAYLRQFEGQESPGVWGRGFHSEKWQLFSVWRRLPPKLSAKQRGER